jgi:glycine cleavage system aminomethyltransferase T
MNFEFLAPDAIGEFKGGAPPLRSPIEWSHRDAGARFGTLDGWRVAAGYADLDEERRACSETVGIADLSFLGKIELQGAPAEVAAIVASLAGGAALELGRASLDDRVWWCPLAAGHVLAITPPDRTASLREQLESAADSASSFASVIELTTAYGSNAVVGPLARETFARATALDMRPERFAEGAFAPVSVARTPAMVLRREGDDFLHLFGAGYAHYVWTVFADAAESLGGRAVGAEALGIELGSEVSAVA